MSDSLYDSRNCVVKAATFVHGKTKLDNLIHLCEGQKTVSTAKLHQLLVELEDDLIQDGIFLKGVAQRMAKFESAGELLVNAIRSSESLVDLKHMVGASQEDWDESSNRIAEIDAIGSKYGYDIDVMPWEIAERYKSLTAEQKAFESQYA